VMTRAGTAWSPHLLKITWAEPDPPDRARRRPRPARGRRHSRAGV